MTADELPELKIDTQKNIVNLGLQFYKASMGFDDNLEIAQKTLDVKKWVKLESVKTRETAIAEELELIRNLDDKDKMDGALYLLIEKLTREK